LPVASWIHAERLVHKLLPVTDEQRGAVDVTRQLIWWFYADLKAYISQAFRHFCADRPSR
jgi:hypothetical protein